MNFKKILKNYWWIGVVVLIVSGSLFAVSSNLRQTVQAQDRDLTPEETAGYFRQANIAWPEDEVKELHQQLGGEPVFGSTHRPINFKKSLTTALDEGGAETTIAINSMTTKDGHTLVTADIGDFITLLINPGADTQELVTCTAISSLTFTGCTRGINTYNNSASSDNIYSHSIGEQVIITNDDTYLTTQYARFDEDGTISGDWRIATKLIFGSTSSSAYIKYDASNSYLIYSNNGTDTFQLGGADSSLVAGNGISIITSTISTRLATTTPALEFNEDGLRLLLDPYESFLSLTSTGLLTGVSTTASDLNLLAGINGDIITASTTENSMMSVFTAGETITGGLSSPTAVTLDNNGDIYKAVNGLASTSEGFVGFAVSTGNAGDKINVLRKEVISGFTGLSINNYYYLTGDAAGEISNATSTGAYANGGIVGRAFSTTELDIGNYWANNVRPGNGALIVDAAEETTTQDCDTGGLWVYVKNAEIFANGNVRFGYNMKSDNTNVSNVGIFINNTQRATGSQTSNVYSYYEHDLSVTSGDDIKVGICNTDGGAIYIKDFQIMIDSPAASTTSS